MDRVWYSVDGSTSDAISAYNAGHPLRAAGGGAYTNQAYVDSVQTYWTWYLNQLAPAPAPAADPASGDDPTAAEDAAQGAGLLSGEVTALALGAIILAALFLMRR